MPQWKNSNLIVINRLQTKYNWFGLILRWSVTWSWYSFQVRALSAHPESLLITMNRERHICRAGSLRLTAVLFQSFNDKEYQPEHFNESPRLDNSEKKTASQPALTECCITHLIDHQQNPTRSFITPIFFSYVLLSSLETKATD